MTASIKTAMSQDIMAQSATQRERIGTLWVLEDGRKFRYAKAGGALAAGKAIVAPTATANHINQAATNAAAIGTTIISQTVGATLVAENAYAGGWLQVNDSTGEGYQYKIQSNTACVASGTTVITLEDPIRVALVASTSDVSLIPNPWMDVAHSTTEENLCAGIAPIAVTDNYYFWCQTGGPACALMVDSPNVAVGSMVTLGATSGSLTAINSTLDVDQPIVGVAWATAGVSGEYKPVWLQID